MMEIFACAIVGLKLKPKRGNALCIDCGTCVKHSVPTKTPLFSSNKVASRKSKKSKALNETMLAAYEEKNKSYHFTQSAQDTTNPHPFQPKRKNRDVIKKGDPH